MTPEQFHRARGLPETFPMLRPTENDKYIYGRDVVGQKHQCTIDNQHAEDLVCAALERKLAEFADGKRFVYLEVKTSKLGWLVKLFNGPENIAVAADNKLDALIGCLELAL